MAIENVNQKCYNPEELVHLVTDKNKTIGARCMNLQSKYLSEAQENSPAGIWPARLKDCFWDVPF